MRHMSCGIRHAAYICAQHYLRAMRCVMPHTSHSTSHPRQTPLSRHSGRTRCAAQRFHGLHAVASNCSLYHPTPLSRWSLARRPPRCRGRSTASCVWSPPGVAGRECPRRRDSLHFRSRPTAGRATAVEPRGLCAAETLQHSRRELPEGCRRHIGFSLGRGRL